MSLKNLKNLPKEIMDSKMFILANEEKVPQTFNKKTQNLENYSDENNYTYTLVECLKIIKNFKFRDIKYSVGIRLDNKEFTVVDLDSCLDSNYNLVKEYAHMESWIEKFASYVEISRSKKGLHIFLKGNKKEGIGSVSKRFYVESEDDDFEDKGEIEIYDSGRFIILTGNVWRNYNSLNLNCQDLLNEFCDYIFPLKSESIQVNTIASDTTYNSSISLIDLHLSYGGTIASEDDKHYKCPCPFHSEKSVGAFTIRKDNSSFNCFSCGAKGKNPISYVILKENCTKEQAKLILKTKNIKRVSTKVIDKDNSIENKVDNDMLKTYKEFYDMLEDTDESEYMIGRGFKQSDLKKYGVKFLNKPLSFKQMKPLKLKRWNKSGFIKTDGYSLFSAPSVIFPVFNDEKEPIYFTSRSCTSAFKMKLRGVKQEFYGTVTSDSKPIFIFEGVIDALSFKKLTGIEENVIAVYGKTSFKKCKEMYPLNTIVICVDADDDQDDYDVAVELGDYFIHPSLICEQYHIERCKDWNDILCSSFNGFVKGDYIDICQRKIETKTQKRYEKVGKLNIFNKEIEMNVLSENEMNDIEDNCIDIIDECDSENVGNKNIIFWKTTMSEDRKGNIKEGPIEFDARLLGEYLNSKGIWKDSSDENCETFIFIDNKIVDTIKNYKITIRGKFKEFFKNDFPLEYKNGFYDKIVSKSKMIDRVIQELDSIDVKSKIVKSTSKINYFFFNNCFVEVSKKEGVVCKPYSELDGLIRKENISPRNFDISDEKQESSKFSNFLMLTQGAQFNAKNGSVIMSNEAKARYIRTRKIIGFLLHDYFDKTLARTVYLTEEKEQESKEQRNGGTGKSLIAEAIKKMRKTYDIHGSNVNFSNNFMFSNCSFDTKVVNLDDVKANFNVGSLYNLCQKPLEIERKFENKVKTENTLKYVFSSNFLLDFEISTCSLNKESSKENLGFNNSDIRRVLPIFVSSFFNIKRQPKNILGTSFFDDEWTNEQWNDFHNFMINCNYMYMCSNHSEFADWSEFEYQVFYRKSWFEMKDCIKFFLNDLLDKKFSDKTRYVTLNTIESLKAYNESNLYRKYDYGEGHFIKSLKTHCDYKKYYYLKTNNIIQVFKSKEDFFNFLEEDKVVDETKPKENIVDFNKKENYSIADDFNS